MIYRTALSRVARTTKVHRGHLSRLLSTRASTVLSALDLTPSSNGTISGVYGGRWGGSGDVLDSVCPATGELLAQVQGVRDCIETFWRCKANNTRTCLLVVGISTRAANCFGKVARSVRVLPGCACAQERRHIEANPGGSCCQGVSVSVSYSNPQPAYTCYYR